MERRARGGKSWRRRKSRQVESGPAELATAMTGRGSAGTER